MEDSKYEQRKRELSWDSVADPTLSESVKISDNTLIERAINFGGFDFVEEVQERVGLSKFIEVLRNSRNLSKKAVNYWCLILELNRQETRTFSKDYPELWTPFR